MANDHRTGARLTVSGAAEVLADAVGLVTARRGGMSSEDFGRLVGETVLEALQSEAPYQRLGWLIGQLAAVAAHTCDQWNKTAGEGDPAGEWLKASARFAAGKRE